MTRPSSSVIARFALLLLSTMVSLAALEGLSRWAGWAPALIALGLAGEDSSPYRRSSNPLLGFELKAGYRGDRDVLTESALSTNSHGQRDVERSLRKPAGTRRILLLGDSVVEGHGLPELEQTISRQLEALYAPERVEVLNFGVSGYCTLAEVELLRTKGLDFAPDVVVLLFVANDFDNFNREAFQLDDSFRRSPMVRGLYRRSHLFRLVSTRLNLFEYGLEADPLRWNRHAIGDNNVVDGLRRFAELARTDGFRPLVAIWPVFEDDGIIDVGGVSGDSSELIVERLARFHGLHTERLSRYFELDRRSRGAQINPRRQYTQGDRVHPSPDGSAVAARALRSILEEPQLALESSTRAEAAGLEATVELAKSMGDRAASYERVHNNRGVELASRGELDLAVVEFRSALESDPDFAEAHNNLGSALWSRGDLDQAIEQYREAVRIRPGLANAQLNLARALATAGERDQAIASFRRALAIDPDLAAAQQGLALALDGAKLSGGAQ